MRILAAGLMLAVCLWTPAHAQNLSLRGPAWAQPLLAADVTPTTGGRAALSEEGLDVAARVTIAPRLGGVARVIRYEARGDDALIALRRFTGHPTSGWWLWGPETPAVTAQSAAVRQEMATLVRGAIGLGGALGNANPNETCSTGEQAFVELSLDGRSITATRACVNNADAVGRLVQRMSDLAGSRNEEELHAAAIEEIMQADRDFAAKALRDGPRAAFLDYAAEDAITFADGAPQSGRDAAASLFADWQEGARLEWAPETGAVSERGDMGWTWGRATYVEPDGARRGSCYATFWKRDYEGRWRFAFDAQIAPGCNRANAN